MEENTNTEAAAEKTYPFPTYTISVQGDDKIYSCVLKDLDRKTLDSVLGFIMPLNGHPSYLTAGEIILFSASWVEGDKEIKTNEDLKNAASMQAINLVSFKQASLKKNSIVQS